ncbi:MAG: preprotein translocase subunit SecG [Clostridiaceae bacterium]|nr:preprotein translocase subunit SecG [Clostridiaceae bacterium]MDD6274149.1 preprotein translocase subunit SecG [Clostridiaceae bacterium]
METLNLIISIVQVVLAIAVIFLVLLQQGKRAGLSGAISGGAETFFGKNKASSMDALLSRLTIILSILLGISTLALNLVH